jgi:DNA-binding CsgD family transcriptional regulator
VNPARTIVVVVSSVMLAVLVATAGVSVEPGMWKLVLVAVAFGAPGALCAMLQPRNPVGWLLLAVGLIFASMGFAAQWVDSGHQSAWASWVVDRSGAIVVPLTFLGLILLPDGHLPSRRWRPVVVTVVALQVGVVVVWSLISGVAPETGSEGGPNPAGALPESWAGTVDTLGDWILQAPFLLVVAAIAVRLRRPGERSRLAGVLGGAAGFAVLAVAGRMLWPGAADVLDILGAAVFGIGLTSTLLRRPEPGPEGDGEPATPAVEFAALGRLSGREQEVLELVAQGLTNRQIAERLVISPVTARNHVSSILTKLGMENRTQAATWLARGRAGR